MLTFFPSHTCLASSSTLDRGANLSSSHYIPFSLH